uniref:Uncharacterized protein n=1 Tax=Leersia perrieri TaxID=77586 RepID=A0A0D9V6Y6_9ORYZ
MERGLRGWGGGAAAGGRDAEHGWLGDRRRLPTCGGDDPMGRARHEIIDEGKAFLVLAVPHKSDKILVPYKFIVTVKPTYVPSPEAVVKFSIFTREYTS